MSQDASDIQAIRGTVQDYFDGMYHSDVERLKRAFHPSASLIGFFSGKLVQIPLEKWLQMIASTPAPAQKGEEYKMTLTSLDLTGEAAAVKVNDLYLGKWFTDYLSLLKIEGKWVIVNKMFTHEPRK